VSNNNYKQAMKNIKLTTYIYLTTLIGLNFAQKKKKEEIC